MAKKKKEATEEKETIQIIKKAKPVKPERYVDGEINMPSSMLKDKESFLTLWKGGLKRTDINQAWQRAEKWLSKYE